MASGGLLTESFVRSNGDSSALLSIPLAVLWGTSPALCAQTIWDVAAPEGTIKTTVYSLPCASNQTADGVSCSTCTGSSVPNSGRTACVQVSSGAMLGPQVPLILLLFLISMLFASL